MVFGSKAICPKCGSPRDEPTHFELQSAGYGDSSAAGGLEQPKPEKGMQGGDMPDDWACPNAGCINHIKMVFGKRSSCPSCGTARNAKQPGDWQCPNLQCLNHRNTVFASKMACPKCGAPRPGAFAPVVSAPALRSLAPALPPAPPMRAALPALAMNGALGALAGPLSQLLALRADLALPSGSSASPGDWRCPNTACMNHRRMVFAKNATCPKCGALKETARSQGGANPGDWQCPNPDCINSRNKVFAKHPSCPACGMEKPEDNGRGRSRSPWRVT